MGHYTKPFLDPDQQVQLLISRGMEITDIEKAKVCLARIGYYRLSAYWYLFRKSETYKDPATDQNKIRVLDDFKDGTDFPTILDLYVFDKKLRMIVLDALERIEITLRTDISLLLGKRDPWAHRNPALLHGNFARRPSPQARRQGHQTTQHQEWISRLDEKFSKSKEDFAKHFKSKYHQSQPPLWIAVELWDFGALSHLYNGMNVADRDAISFLYGIPPGNVLETWLRCLNDVRNICAHHSRLWNKPLVNQPRWPTQGQVPDFDHLDGDSHGQTRLYSALLIMQFMLKTINPSSSWGERFRTHAASLPQSPHLTLRSAGFPNNWQNLPIWS